MQFAPLLLGALALCWLLALCGVIYEAVAGGRPWALLWWLPLTLLLGPLAAVVFLGHSRSPADSVPVFAATPLPAEPATRVAYATGAPTLPWGSGVYLLVRAGAAADMFRSVELPAGSALVVRRAGRSHHAGAVELLLHDSAVSRSLHCTISSAYGALTLEDASSNGTLVDQQRVHRAIVPLHIGSTIQIGATTLVLCDERQLAATEING